MVRDRLRDGTRIAQLLASEIEGGGGALAALSVVDADPDVEPTTDGAFAFAIERDSGVGDGDHGDDADDVDSEDRVGDADEGGAAEPGAERVAEVFVQPDRARVEFRIRHDAAASSAGDADLRVRPKAVRPPRTLVFLEDGADVKRVLPVFEAAVGA